MLDYFEWDDVAKKAVIRAIRDVLLCTATIVALVLWF